jgi:predicted Zn-dependent protease
MCGVFMTGHTKGFRCAIGHNDCTVSEFRVSVIVTGRSAFQYLPHIPSAKGSVETRNVSSYAESARVRSRAVSTLVCRFFTL